MRIPRIRPRRLILLAVVGVLLMPALWVSAKLIKCDNSDIWFPPYAKEFVKGEVNRADETTDLIFLMTDHWEPGNREESPEYSQRWLDAFAEISHRHLDTQGRNFRYSWFYPVDRMDERILAQLAVAARNQLGETEVHWHHHHDSVQQFRTDLENALVLFQKYGHLTSEPGGDPHWCFIHGNWALDGSEPNACGINNEIDIFLEHGCYADMTFPSLGWDAQPSLINKIYYAQDTPEPKSYDTGELARVGTRGEGLLMLPGPMGLNFQNMLVLIEAGAIDDAEGTGFSGALRKPDNNADYFKSSRVGVWDNIHVSVEGKPEWCFVKVHAHGMQHRDLLLNGQFDSLLSALEKYAAERKIRLHYVTAREAVNLVHAAEQGLPGSPEQYYDLEIPPPLSTREVF